MKWAFALAAFGWSAMADAQALIQGMTADKVGDGAEIHINGTDLARPRVIRSLGGRQFIFEFAAAMEGQKKLMSLGYGNVEQAKLAWNSNKPPKIWLVVKLSRAGVTPTVSQTADGWSLSFGHGDIATPVVQTPPTTSTSTSGFTYVLRGGKTSVAPIETPKPTVVSGVTPLLEKDLKPAKPVEEKPKSQAEATRIKIQNVDPASTPLMLSSLAQPGRANRSRTMDLVWAGIPVLEYKTTDLKSMLGSFRGVAAQPIDDDGHGKKKGLPELAPLTAPSKAAPSKESPAAAPSAPRVTHSAPRGSGSVTMDFANTDVATVVRAIAMQTRESIVVTPDVSGKVTVNLDHVSVKEALDTITAASGLRYSKVGTTYFVAPADKFDNLMIQLRGTETGSEIHIVPLQSGRGGQISLAVQKAIPNNAALTYTIALPSENIKHETSGSKSEKGGGGEEGGKGGDGGGSKTQGKQSQEVAATDRPGFDPYMILVGPKAVIEVVEDAVKRMDRDLCTQLGVPYPETWSMGEATYICQANSAKNLLAAICEPQNVDALKTQPLRTVYGRVELFASPAVGTVNQKVFLRGPKQDVDRLLSLLAGIDDAGLEGAQLRVYEVRFGDPRALRDDLLAQVPGIRVAIPAASVGAAQAYKENKAVSDAQTQGTGASQGGGEQKQEGGASGSSSSSGSSGTTTLPGAGGDKGDQQGLGLPFKGMELETVPMRLVLRGTKSQIEQAMDYLGAIDTAPRQIALEMRVMELSRNDAVNAGLNWNLFTGGAVKFLNLNNSQGSATNNSGTFNVDSGGIKGDVVAQLDKIATKNNLIARPNMLATDGRQTEIFVGDAIRYVESIISSQNGPSVTTNTVRVGVRLAILPRVGADGNITLDLRPLVSFLKGWIQVPQIGGQLPQTSERVGQSTLTMKSGETIAIGGLIQDQDRKDGKGLPGLMDLPVLGNLFKRTTNSRDQVELVIFLTARDVNGPATSASYTLPMNDPKAKGGK